MDELALEVLRIALPKIYEDGAQPAVKRVGNLLENTVIACSWLLTPIEVAAFYKKKFYKDLEDLSIKLKDKELVEPAIEIAVPILETLRHTSETHLRELYLQLLASAMDKDKVADAHPAFIMLIKQLSPDEAIILRKLSARHYERHIEHDFNRETDQFSNRRHILCEFPKDELVFSINFEMYINHLIKLGLVAFPVYDRETVWEREGDVIIGQNGTVEKAQLLLTDFGRLFINTCDSNAGI